MTDWRGRPGDIVLVRGGQPIDVWRGLDDTRDRAGVIMPGAMGIIIATHVTAWTYVLWSCPTLCGWVWDGRLRKVKT